MLASFLCVCVYVCVSEMKIEYWKEINRGRKKNNRKEENHVSIERMSVGEEKEIDRKREFERELELEMETERERERES